jgi:UDPglucose 6-dehydrogenase
VAAARVEQPLTRHAAQLCLQGAAVCVTDPVAIENSRRQRLQTDHAATPEEAADRAKTG